MSARPSLLLLLVAAACKEEDPSLRPPEACRTGEDAGPRFADQTDSIGLPEGVQGNRLGTVDFDGDLWPDLWVATGATGPRDDFEADPAVRHRFLLRNLGGQGWEDVTLSSGFSRTRDGGDGRAWNFVLWGDLDNDGDLDSITFLHTWDTATGAPDLGDRTEILLNDGAGRFEFAPRGLSEELLATAGASLLDANHDGLLDLWTGQEYGTYGRPETNGQDRLYLGEGGGDFDDETTELGLETESGGGIHPDNAANYVLDDGAHVRWASYGAAACDIDSDGDTDVMGLTYGRGFNQVWANDGTGHFENATAESGFGMDDNVDYSDNEFFRCHCEDNPAQPDCQGVPAPVIQCPDGPTWTPGWDDQEHRNGGNTFGGVCADLDGDGDLDFATAAIRHWWAGEGSDRSTILWNDGGTPPVFRREENEDFGLVTEHVGSWNEGDLNVAAFDFDQDGWLDLLRPQSDYDDQRLYLFRGLGDGRFEDVALAAGLDMPRAAGLAVDDFDRDGDLDVFTSFSTMRCTASSDDCPWDAPVVRYFRNEQGQSRNGLRVRLAATTGNARGVGAQVVVRAGGRSYVRELLAGHGHQGLQNGTDLHFGLGESCVAETVSVYWNDGRRVVDIWDDVPANWNVTFLEGLDDPLWEGWAAEAE